jgi:hypothetical protein
MTRSRSTIRLALVLAAAAAGLAGLVWIVRAAPDDRPRIELATPEAAPRRDLVRVIAPAEESSARAPSIEPPQSTPAATKEPPASTAADARTFELVGLFVRPDRKALELDSASVELCSASGERRREVVLHATSVRIAGLAPGRWTVDVEAPGHTHRRQTLDLAPEKGATAVEERLVLWPERWIAVIARTSDGRPFAALAEDLGVEPKRLFVGAFELRVRSDPPDEQAWDGKPETLATFHPPPTYQAWELPGGGVLGSLELHADPPMWVGLRVHGMPLEWKRLAPADREIVFVLDLPELERTFARLSLRVVDAQSGRPIAGAKVTVRADTSAHRRKDLENVETGADGRVEIARVIPGGHELSVTDGKAIAQDHFVLAAGEARDLGDVALARGEPIPLLVEDENGKPLRAFVEVGRFVEGGRVSELYPQMLRYHTDEQGRFAIPRPSATSIVRASVEGSRSNGRVPQDPYSANVLVAVDAPASKTIVLVLRLPLGTRFETHAKELATIEIEDELGIVVDWTKADAEGIARRELLPGRYRARFLDGRGQALGEAPFEVRGSVTRVTWP